MLGSHGADGRIRTGDLILTKDALYRLSYISVSSFDNSDILPQANEKSKPVFQKKYRFGIYSPKIKNSAICIPCTGKGMATTSFIIHPCGAQGKMAEPEIPLIIDPDAHDLFPQAFPLLFKGGFLILRHREGQEKRDIIP